MPSPDDIDVILVAAEIGVMGATASGSVGPHDLLIGATAIVAGYSVATRDRRRFGRTPGLELLVL